MAIVRRGSTIYSRVVGRLPWVVSALVGLACVVLGLLLVIRPFGSLAVLIVVLCVGLILNGVAELLKADRPRTAVVASVVWIAAAVLVLVLPGLTIAVLTVVVGLALVVAGLANGLRALRGNTEQRVADLLLAVSTVILGLLAFTWRDVTVLVIAALFGVRMIIFGVDQVVAGIRRARGTPVATEHAHRERWQRWLRAGSAGLALLASVALLLVSVQLSGTPEPDSFYTASTTVPNIPGQLLRSEPFTRTIPAGARAWKILYTTTITADHPAIASAIVVVPDTSARHPVIAWAHGTTGFGTGCAPSLLDEPFVAGAMPDFHEALARGWAVVATDYIGLGTADAEPYLIGQGEGRSVLDSVRAAQQLTRAHLMNETVIWGHSQGGHAALWAGGLATTYAPGIDLVGVAAMAPASNLPALMSGLSDSAAGGLFGSFALAAYAAAYPDVKVDDYVRPGARILVQSMQQRCLTDPSTLVSIVTSVVGDKPIWSKNPDTGALAIRAKQNVPTLPIAAPLLIAQGGADTLVLPKAQASYVAGRCAVGEKLDYRIYPGEDHMGVVTGESPLLGDLLTWTADRFAGDASPTNCPA